MAAYTRYVNTDNTVSGDGTTNTTDGTATSAFTTLAACLPTTKPAYLSATDTLTVHCSGVTADTARVDLDSTWNGVIVVVNGNLAGRTYDTTKYRREYTSTSTFQYGVLTAGTVDLTLNRIQAKRPAGATHAFHYLLRAIGLSKLRVYRSILDYNDGTQDGGRCVSAEGDASLYLRNTLLRGTNHASGSALWHQGTSVQAYAANCTFEGAGYVAISRSAGTPVVKNCLFTGNAADTNDFVNVGGNNNATTNATGIGTSPRVSQTFTFVNAANADYGLASTDAGARGFGADLSADSNLAVTDDIEGEARSAPYDIGYDQYVAPADTTVPTRLSAAVAADGLSVAITFSEDVVLNDGDATGFTIQVNGTTRSATGASAAGAVVTIPVSSVIYDTDTVTDAYQNFTGNVRDTAATPNQLATYTAQSTTNGSTVPAGGVSAEGAYQLVATARKADTSVANRAKSWGTSNAAVAVVGPSGYVEAVGPGTCDITVTCAGLTKTCAVTVPAA